MASKFIMLSVDEIENVVLSVTDNISELSKFPFVPFVPLNDIEEFESFEEDITDFVNEEMGDGSSIDELKEKWEKMKRFVANMWVNQRENVTLTYCIESAEDGQMGLMVCVVFN